jgi:glutaredoxin 3
MEKKVVIYTSPTCHFCHELKKYLDEKSIEFEERDVSEKSVAEEVVKKTGQLGVPVTFVGEAFVVGFDEKKIKKLLG